MRESIGNSTGPDVARLRPVLQPFSPSNADDDLAVRAQLDRLLNHPLFSQSKRYPALLRFVVEQSLEGNAAQVKERSIGMDVFKRPPNYDANADPVVRVTAGEIRKRLAQYYYDPAHSEELRIELPTGTYVPVFQRFSSLPPADQELQATIPSPSPAESSPEPATTPDQVPATGAWPAALLPNSLAPVFPGDIPGLGQLVAPIPLASQSPTITHRTAATSPGVSPTQPTHYHSQGHPNLIFLLSVVSLLLGLAAGYAIHQHRQALAEARALASPEARAQRDLDDFWNPVTSGPATVTLCLGEPARDSSSDSVAENDATAPDPGNGVNSGRGQPAKPRLAVPLYFHLRQSGLFALADVTTLAHLSTVLDRHRKGYRVSAASEARFAQLREGPAILIGAFDNLWTIRLTHNLRFGFDSIRGNAVIVDRKSPAKTTWTMAWDQPSDKLTRDYAIVARYLDPTTGQPTLITAGISEEGTEAAGELVSNPAYLSSLLETAPPDWRNKNIEAVIETQVIDGHAGPPQVRTVEFW